MVLKPQKASIIDQQGNSINLRNSVLSFSNPQADTLITAPNEAIMRALHAAFKVDACYVRYLADIQRTYKRFIIFTLAGLPQKESNEFINWVSYLRVHQEPKDDLEFHLL